MVTGEPDKKQSTPGKPQSRGKRYFRLCFRCFRIFILLILLTIVTALFFLNKVGLPDFIKARVIAQLRSKGWDANFSRLRLRFYRGVVAEQLYLERADRQPGPHVFVEAAACRFDYEALLHKNLVINSVKLDGGRVVWPIPHTNQPLPALQINDIKGNLRFHTNDVWQLDNLSGRMMGFEVQFTGTLSNGSFIRDWKLPKPKEPRKQGLTESVMRRVLATLDQIKFNGTPKVDLKFTADAANLRESLAEMNCRVAGVDSPWVQGTNLLLVARLSPSSLTNEWFEGRVEFKAEQAHLPFWNADARVFRLNASLQPPFTNLFPSTANLVFALEEPQTHWGKASHLDMVARVVPDPANSAALKADVDLTATTVETKWFQSRQVQLAFNASHANTNWNPADASGRLLLAGASVRDGTAESVAVEFAGHLPSTNEWVLSRTNLDWGERLANFPVTASITVTNFQSQKLNVQRIGVKAGWEFPLLHLAAESRLYDGELTAKLKVNSKAREVVFEASSHFDAQKIGGLLTTNARRWLASYAWKEAPKLRAQGRIILPPSADGPIDWKKDIMPTFSVSGEFDVGEGSYRGIPFLAARSPFAFSNMIWRIPELKVTRPEGELVADYFSDQRTRDFHWQLRSGIDPRAIKPFFDKENQQHVFDSLEFTTPPRVEAEIWGRWQDVQRLGAAGRVIVTNAAFRGEKVDFVSSWFRYTNQVLCLLEPKALTKGKEGNAPGVSIDFIDRRVWFTNVVGNLDAHSVTRMIGKGATRALEPFQFDEPPIVRLNGSVDFKRGRHQDDLHFDIAGQRFHWQGFLLQQVTANLDWVGHSLLVTNAHGTFRTGQVGGNADFNFGTERKGADFKFNLSMADLDLKTFVEQLGFKTNKLEGSLTGELHVTRGNTENWKAVDGNGFLDLKDGLLWDIPIFGVFSPVLNAVIPGLGNSRAKEATATYAITNGVIYSRDLEIRATAMRMEYEGAVDLDQRVDGKMGAELLRDMPAFGFVISKILWPVTKLFEYKITGTLKEPKTEPLYVLPKIILMPFHPIKTIKELLPDETKPPVEKPAAPAPPKQN
ncbi:MAG: hypothetical protein JWM16_2227 [Verrucomicrobiales bacterium]|nr:hypothetical protein [Verrucomicrobiales bacterium]